MIELQKGTTLIEASAGTGKTYTLCRIALQLTLQEGITLDRILAVTFTEAATEELAARLQSLYQTCLRELETDRIEEPVLEACATEEEFDRERALNALRYSLEVFDEAPISTIHGFCRRALELVALETQTPLDAELNQVESELIERLQDEYIRQNILEASTALSLALETQKQFPSQLRALGQTTAAHPEAKLLPTPPPLSIETLDRRFSELLEAFGELQKRATDFETHLARNREPYKQLISGKPDLKSALRRGSFVSNDLEWIGKLNTDGWRSGLKKSGQALPIPPAVALVDVFLDQIDQAFLSLLYNYRGWLSERLERAKLQANSISFNDLLRLLQRALSGPAGEPVRAFLSSRYDAALIDEFQDTDRTQLEIARALFGNGEHYLFYIGDPKQAIYRFRGADIYAYFKAVEGGELRRETLDRNFRSAPKLVAAVNLLFANAAARFVDPRIQFLPVKPGRAEEEFSPTGPPIRIVQAQLENPEKPRGKSDYTDWLARKAADDFADRLNRDRELRAADAAFLVNTKYEAARLSDALLERGIASAIRAERSVFQTAEAAELRQVLASLAMPARASLKRGVFALLNRHTKAEVFANADFEEKLAPLSDYLSAWAREWSDRNFDVSLQGLLAIAADGVAQEASLDAERRYANVRQLSELLSEARDAEELSPRGLHNWLCRKSEIDDVSNHEEWQTRISSDEGKPQILTIHKSKGLQFPIVFLPFLGLRRIRIAETATSYHADDDSYIVDLAAEPDSEAAERARSESLAEDVRLLYVALTRAERETHIYLCPEEMKKGSTPLAASSFARFLLGEDAEITTERLADRLTSLAAESDDGIAFSSFAYGSEIAPATRLTLSGAAITPAPVSERPLRSRDRLPSASRVLSFSALNRSLHRMDETDLGAQEDESVSAAADEAAPLSGLEPDEPEAAENVHELSIFTLPKGRHAGDLLHLILERYDFSRPDTLASTTQFAFESLQFEPRAFEAIVAAQIDAIARLPLQNEFGTFSLSETDSRSRVAELEFAYPVSSDIKKRFISILATHDLGRIPSDWGKALAESDGSVIASMLRGFIDLVVEHDGRFYLFDWKSNYLGPNPSDYDEAAMLESMSEHNYFLQYLLYCIALKRFLAWRFPDQSFSELFGGVYYLYARGISPGKETGVFFDRPSEELLVALDGALTSEGGPR